MGVPFDLRIYVAVTSPYPWNRGVTLMLTSWVVKPSPTTGVLSGKAPVTEVSLVQVLSSSSEEHVDYSGDEVDFGDDLLLLTPVNIHTFLRRCRWMSLQWFRHRESSPPPRVFFLSHLLFSSYEHCLNARLIVICWCYQGCLSCDLLHIEEMIKELVQPGGFEVPSTDTVSVGTTTATGEPSSWSSLPKDLLSSDPQLGKRIKVLYKLPFSLLLLTLML